MKIMYKKFKSERRFGIELEVNATQTREYLRDIISKVSERHIYITMWDMTNNNNFWHVKYDSTCGVLGKGQDHGWEIASFIASGDKDIKEITDVTNELGKSLATINTNCGLHVHAEVADFSVESMAVLCARWIKIENLMFQMVPKHRRGNIYCKPLGRYKTSVISAIKNYKQPDDRGITLQKEFWNIIKPNNISVHENNQKKVALNIVNYARAIKDSADKRKTVELRIPEGTLDGNEVSNWVRLFLLFVDKCKNKAMPTTMKNIVNLDRFLSFFGLSKEDEFHLLDESLHKLRIWMLNRFIQYGNRAIAKQAVEKLEMISP